MECLCTAITGVSPSGRCSAKAVAIVPSFGDAATGFAWWMRSLKYVKIVKLWLKVGSAHMLICCVRMCKDWWQDVASATMTRYDKGVRGCDVWGCLNREAKHVQQLMHCHVNFACRGFQCLLYKDLNIQGQVTSKEFWVWYSTLLYMTAVYIHKYIVYMQH